MSSSIAIGANIARIRKEAHLTQEDLALFLGVTKASVSKWETGQSCPDIELLPRIATYFGITIDALVGYQPQMTKAGIRAACARLRSAFAEEGFAAAHAQCQELVRDYYACFPLLMQIVSLYLNHLSLANETEQAALIDEAIGLCRRVRAGSSSVVDLKQAQALEAMFLLISGKPQAAIETLSDALEPEVGADIVLARAYAACGDAAKADEALQVMLYQALILCLNRLSEMAMLRAADKDQLDALYGRACALIDAFDFDALFVNAGAIYLVFAMAYVMGGNIDDAFACLTRYESAVRAVEFPIKLHGDAFFDKIEPWLGENLPGGIDMPRDDAFNRQSIVDSVAANPVFAGLAEDPRFKRIVASLRDIAQRP